MSYDPIRLFAVKEAPAWMTMAERVVLYALVVGLRPERVLEIGTFQGGSTLIICAALDDLGSGRVVCLDPKPQIASKHMRAIANRAVLMAERSPEALPAAAEAAGGAFDFAFIDGDHTFEGVLRDLEGVLPTLADSAHLLLHDAHHDPVGRAIGSFLMAHPAELQDAGLVSVEVTPHEEQPDALNDIRWGGLRLLLYKRAFV